MKRRIMYIEHKTNQNDRGEAWIGEVEFSKSGQTLYFNNRAFKKMKMGGTSGNYYDLETGETYWISGVKKDGQDRHWAGGGRITIERRIVDEYLKLGEWKERDNAHFEIIDVVETDKTRFHQLENERYG